MNRPVRAVLVALLPAEERAYTLGFGYLKAYADARPDVAAGAQIALVERAAEDALEASVAEILTHAPDLVGFHVQLCNEDVVAAAAEKVRRLRPQARIILGGQEASRHPERLLRKTDADAVVLDEGEESFAELLGAACTPERWSSIAGLVIRRGDEVVRTPARALPADLAVIPSPYADPALVAQWRHLPAAVLETTRGCPYHCRFCSWPNAMKPRHFPLERVRDEIRTLLTMKPDFLVHLADPDIFLHPERARVILETIGRQDPEQRSRWWFNTYLGNMTEELASLCNHRGFVLEGGLQSTNPEALRAARRRFDGDAVKRSVALLREHAPRARLAVQLILGLPGDSLDGFLRSLDWVCRLGVREVHVFHMQVMPATAFDRDREQWGIDADREPPYGLRSHATFSADDIARGRRAALRMSLLGRSVPVWDALLRGAGDALLPEAAAALTRFADEQLHLGLEAAITRWEQEDCMFLTPLTGGEDPAPSFRLIEAADRWLDEVSA